MRQVPAVVFVGVEQVEVREVGIPDPGPGQLLVRAEATVVSPGTELRCLRGLERDSQNFPYIPGYSMVGRVEAGGPDTGTPVGTRLYLNGTQAASIHRMWGGHVGCAVVAERDTHPVPEGIAPADAVFAHLAGIAYRGVRAARPLPSERVAVIGLGPIGQLSLRLVGLTGASVLGVDRDPDRLEAARRDGFHAVASDGPAGAAVRSVWPDGADVVVDATGAAAAFRGAVEAARDQPWGDVDRPGPRIVVQGSYADEFPVPYPGLFLREASVLFPRDCQPQDLRAMLGLMARGLLRPAGLAGATVPPAEAPGIYARLLGPSPGLLTALIDWTGA